ncbi:MAG TPA: hypothetical protein VGE93_17430 [Bryobacteraceae bacterium]
MNHFALSIAILSAVFLSGTAQAMDIVQYDQMTSQDRQAFLNFVPQVAETVLNQEGRSADAAKVYQLFNDIGPGDNLPVGEAEFELNLDAARVRDAEKHAKNHDAPRVQVETALISTLKKNGIEMTPDFIKDLFQLTGTIRR